MATRPNFSFFSQELNGGRVQEGTKKKRKETQTPRGGGGGGSQDASGSQEVLSTTCVQLLVARLWRASRVEAVGVVCSFSRSSAAPGPLTNLFQLTSFRFPHPIRPREHGSPLLFDGSVGPSCSRCIVDKFLPNLPETGRHSKHI